MAFSVRMGIKRFEETLVKIWGSTGASMDDTRKRLCVVLAFNSLTRYWSIQVVVLLTTACIAVGTSRQL